VGRYSTATAFFLLAVLLAMAAPVSANPGYEVLPSIDVSNFITYEERQGDTTVRQVFPTSFRIQWYGEYDKVVNGWLCWAWWDPNCDPATYKYAVESKQYSFEVSPPQVIEYAGSRILLTYFASLSVIAYASKTWYGYLEEHVKVSISVYAYGTIDRPPDTADLVDLGELISSITGSEGIVLNFATAVRRTEPSQASYTEAGSFDLLLRGLTLSFYRLYTSYIHAQVVGAMPLGRFNTDGYIGIVPKGIIYASLCLRGPSGFTLGGTLSYISKYGTQEVPVLLSSDPNGGCSFASIQDVVLTPGNYTGNNKFTLIFKSGALMINIRSDAEVKGSMGIASMPFIVITPGDQWTASLYIGVEYTSYQSNERFFVNAGGTIYIEDRSGVKMVRDFTCGIPTSFTGSGTYKCVIHLHGLGITPQDAVKAYADVVVEVSMYGVTYSDRASISCALITPSTVHGLVASLYDVISRGAFLVILGLLFLYVVNYVAHQLGRPLVDPYFIFQGLVSTTILLTAIFLVPYFSWFLLSLLYVFPEFSQVLSTTPLNNPDQVLGMPPNQAVALLMSFYDMTLNELKTDYKLWFESQMMLGIFVKLVAIGLAVSGLIAIGIALSVSLSSGIVGAILGPLLGFAMTIIGMIITLTPLAGVVNALIAIAEFVLIATALTFLIIFALGLLNATIPLPLTTRLAEDFIGGGLLYVLSIPNLAPIIYSIYLYVRSSLDFYIKQVEQSLPSIPIGILNVGIDVIVPVAPLMKMIGYVTLASLTTLMIILVHAYALSRTGLMTGLGEAIMKVSRR